MRRNWNRRPRLLSRSASIWARMASSCCEEAILSPENAAERAADDLPCHPSCSTPADRFRKLARYFGPNPARHRARHDLTGAQALPTLVVGPKHAAQPPAKLPQEAAVALRTGIAGRRLAASARRGLAAETLLELLVGGL